MVSDYPAVPASEASSSAPLRVDGLRELRTNPPTALQATNKHLVVAVDYGTTFTGVAYLPISGIQKEEDLETLAGEINVIKSWAKREADKVPSDFSYSPSLVNGCQQWGYDIDEFSRVLKWTKLALEETYDREQELRNLSSLLYEMRLVNLTTSLVLNNDLPRHLSKEPEDILKDYLEQVAEKTYEEIVSQVGRRFLEQTPVDIVVTHPAKWSDRAMNEIFRAVTATFNESLFPKLRNISFVSEPEACAHYTLREAWQRDHIRFRKNDCFIVVDAGGGTVDVASYKVTSMDFDTKQIKLEQVGYPLGRKCGATYIDTSFIRFVKDRVGESDWEQLNHTDGQDSALGGHNIVKPNVRILHERFEPVKHQFDGKGQAVGVQLPRGIGAVDDEEKGILNGVLRITPDDLRLMFKESVEQTLMLISQAVAQIEIAERLKVRKIFLSGGFGKSPYLFKMVKQFGNTRRIDVERGDDCWAAVVKGAIIKSLGLYTQKLPAVIRCPRHYGIKIRARFSAYKHKPSDAEVDVEGVSWATNQIRWFIQKGDAIFPGKAIVVTYDCHWSMKASDYPAKRRSPGSQATESVFRDVVFIASAANDPPTRLDELSGYTSQVATLRCDLTKVPQSAIAEYRHPTVGQYLKFWTRVQIIVLDKVQINILAEDTVLCSLEMPL